MIDVYVHFRWVIHVVDFSKDYVFLECISGGVKQFLGGGFKDFLFSPRNLGKINPF